MRYVTGRWALFSVVLLAAVPAMGQVPSEGTPAAARWSMLENYCTECHNTIDWAGGVAYDTMTPADVPHDVEIWEGTVRKLRGNLMPPPGSRQPTQAEKDSLVGWLETSLDARRETPRAGHVAAQRLNRTEYANAVRSLLGVDIQVEDLLPPEVELEGFNNIAAALSVSPTFVDQYVSAARFIAPLAVGSTRPKLGKTVFLPSGGSTDDLPPGNAGGFRFTNIFPADGEYRLSIQDDLTGGAYPNAALHRRTIMIFVDGQPVFRGEVGGKEDLGLADRKAAGGRAKVNARFADIPVHVTSGAHEITVVQMQRSHALSDDPLGGGAGGRAAGAFRRGVELTGPHGPTTLTTSASREKFMVCVPQDAAGERSCAEEIARNLAYHAYRRPVTDADIAYLMDFYDSGRSEIGDFNGGVQEIVMAVLSSPDFLYRIIQPKGLPPDDSSAAVALSALELASRLSFFIWSDLPDDELLRLAVDGSLVEPAVYDQQLRRMLLDKRAAALVTGFAMRWLNVDDLAAVEPDPTIFPGFTDAMRRAFSTEIELFMGEVLLQNRSVIDLLTGEFTYVNAALANHYGMRGVVGSQFRRVVLTDDNRRGLLGKAAVLLRTSYGNRTSPVLRGSWVLGRLMGTPATPPPPGVETNLSAHEGDRPTTLRARLEVHRQAASCNQCHGVIDPIGLAMENFDVVGAWRTRDSGLPVNASTVLPDGRAIDGVAQLREALAARPGQFALAMTEKLMMYATGREVEPSDMPQVRQVVHEAGRNGYRFFDLVMGIAKSDAFRMQKPRHDDAPRSQQPAVASVR